MKLHIENINITIQPPQQQPAGLLATLAIASASAHIATGTLPKIGDKWPGTEATYAGVSLSLAGDSLVHLLLWNDDNAALEYDEAVAHAEAINRDMASHLPSRHQAITLFENLQHCLDQDRWHWTLTKTKSGKSALFQDFYDGYQLDTSLSAECRVRAVSEIPL